MVDVLLAEDTRKTGRFLHLCGISGPRLLSLFEHNEQARTSQVLRLLKQGRQAALVSSAGTPLMSDPGYFVVQACRQAGFRVSPVPGPSAPIAALMTCGLPPYPFAFLGFVPRKSGEKRRLFEQYAKLQLTLVFFERLSRLEATLQDGFAVLGSRRACIAREMTKKHEEFIHVTLDSSSLGELSTLPGEATVIVAPQDKSSRHTSREEVVQIMRSQAGPDCGAKAVVEGTLPLVLGWGKKELYALYLREIRDKANLPEES